MQNEPTGKSKVVGQAVRCYAAPFLCAAPKIPTSDVRDEEAETPEEVGTVGQDEHQVDCVMEEDEQLHA